MDQERYELMDVIGSGGMATVWRANDTRLGRRVALKRPHPAPPGSVTLTRFAREARAAATVNHPHLVAVYDTGEDETGPYLVMELVDGPSLAQGSPSEDIAVLGAQIASALAALHAAGIVHGDVKPANVLLADSGAKLTDFGIALTVDDTSALTQPGIALGTPAYAAPEIVAGGARTAAADVYSLGALLHELVTGSRWDPSSGSTQAMPNDAWRPILAAALSTDPARRPTAAALTTALADLEDPYAATTPMVVAPPGAAAARTNRGGRLAVAIALLTVTALGVVAWIASRSNDDLAAADVGAIATSLSVPVAETTAPTVTVVDSTVPTTLALTTLPATTLPPTTLAPTTVAAPTAPELAEELIGLIEGVPSDELKPREARDITRRVDEAMRAATDGDMRRAEDELRAAAERIERSVDGDAQVRALQLVATLASTLGVDVSEPTGPGDRDADD